MDFLIDERPASIQSPGLGIVYYSEVGNFTAIAGLPASPTTQAEKVTISDDHTFPTDEGFREIYSTDNRKKFDVNGFGGRESGGADNIIELFYPGSREEFDAFLKDDPELIILVGNPDCSSGKFSQIGTKCSPAKIMKDWNFTSQVKGASEDAGYLFKVQAFQASKLTYTGTVTLAV
jgi:hypothetical protein